MKSHQAAFNIGRGLAQACASERSNSTEYQQSLTSTLCKSAGFQSKMFREVRDMYDLCDKSYRFERQLFDKAASDCHNPDSQGLRESLSEIVLESFGREKRAGVKGVASAVTTAGRAGLGLAPGVLKGLLLAGSATGAGLGSLAWYLNRDANQDDQDINRMQEQIDTYNRITHEISQNLYRKGVGAEDMTDEELRDISGADSAEVYA